MESKELQSSSLGPQASGFGGGFPNWKLQLDFSGQKSAANPYSNNPQSYGRAPHVEERPQHSGKYNSFLYFILNNIEHALISLKKNTNKTD